MKNVTVLIPTLNRTTSLAVMLMSIVFQTYTNFDVVISDQSDTNSPFEDPTIQTVIRLFRQKNHTVHTLVNLPKYGIAQQRQFLLDHAHTSYSLFLDDDLILEPYVLEGMVKVIEKENCGFVGRAPIGLSFYNDVRCQEEHIRFWKGKVKPETVSPNTSKWNRHRIHNAANILHIEEKLGITYEKQKTYKIAWIGACVLYDTEKLKKTGGFSFWKKLPSAHCGEDVLAQLRVMKKYGGCGILPSGVYHQEVPTTLPSRDINAPEFISV